MDTKGEEGGVGTHSASCATSVLSMSTSMKYVLTVSNSPSPRAASLLETLQLFKATLVIPHLSFNRNENAPLHADTVRILQYVMMNSANSLAENLPGDLSDTSHLARNFKQIIQPQPTAKVCISPTQCTRPVRQHKK